MRQLKFAAPFAGFGARLDCTDRLAVALFASAALHLFVIFALHFKLPDLKKLANLPPPLEVVLVNSKSASRPLQADALAQANLEGGGNTDLDRRAKSPLPTMNQDQPESDVQQASQRVREMEQQAQQLMTQIKSKHSTEEAQAAPQQAQEKVEAPNTSNLAQRSLAMARMEAQISRDWDSYQKRPKRAFVGARTREYRFAQYVEDWRVKVERVGNLNYPEAARQQKLYGYLQLTVAIGADGRVESIEINRSSGHKVLDAAARRIVELAAPYAPFPDDIRKDTDVLSITRTWIFTRADQLVSE